MYPSSIVSVCITGEYSRKEHLLRIFTSPEEHRFMRVCVVAGMCRPIHRESNVTSCAGTEMTRRYTLNLRRQHGNTQYEKAGAAARPNPRTSARRQTDCCTDGGSQCAYRYRCPPSTCRLKVGHKQRASSAITEIYGALQVLQRASCARTR